MSADERSDSNGSAPERTPVVFISYAHDSEEHKLQVLQLDRLLRSAGIETVLDRYFEATRRHWYQWAVRNIEDSDFTIAVASPIYRQAGDGRLPPDKHRGAQAETRVLQDKLTQNRQLWEPRILPVILPGQSFDGIPGFLDPTNCTNCPISSFSFEGAVELFGPLLEMSKYAPTPVGQIADTRKRLRRLWQEPASMAQTTIDHHQKVDGGPLSADPRPGANSDTATQPDSTEVIAAHSRNDQGRWHTLAEHSRSTGSLAADFATSWDGARLAWGLGLLHDAGKVAPGWQTRLREVEGTSRRVGCHEDLGTRMLRAAAGPAAMAALGHHRGLESRAALKRVLRTATPEDDVNTERFLALVPEARDVVNGTTLVPDAWINDALLYEMGLRMTFSALVDADRLDTAAHKAGTTPVAERRVDMAALVERFEHRRAELLKGFSPTPMDAVRQEVYEAAVSGAQRRPHLYRLTAPTGSAKTLAQGGFALHHAARWGKRRVVVAMPLVTVTEQNAQVYRELLDGDEPIVLENHSQVTVDEEGDADRAEWARLATENWDAPFVLTTTVQLFETLMSRSPSQARKLHRLADSVLVLDEVQALPPKMLLPILDALRLLVQHFGTTVLLTSATQPAFESLSVWRDLGLEPEELMPNVPDLFDRSRRVSYEWRLDPQPTLAEVAAEVGALEQALVIVNSTKDSRHLYRVLRKDRQDVWHLSSRMYPRHRARVLREVSDRLESGLPVLLVATQLVEAGVDISFPVVWRALAPADSLQQSAGRAGRHGGPGSGRVVVFDPADGHAPPEYKVRIALTRTHFGPDLATPDDATALNAYYKELYLKLKLDRTNPRAKSNLNAGQTIQEHRSKLDYRAVLEGGGARRRSPSNDNDTFRFQMIEQTTVPVVVLDPEDSAAEDVRAKLKLLDEGTATATEVVRGLQRWIVTLPVWSAKTEDAREQLQRLGGDLHLWRGSYDAAVGIDDDAVLKDATG